MDQIFEKGIFACYFCFVDSKILIFISSERDQCTLRKLNVILEKKSVSKCYSKSLKILHFAYSSFVIDCKMIVGIAGENV